MTPLTPRDPSTLPSSQKGGDLKPIDLEKGSIEYQGRTYQSLDKSKSTSIFDLISSLIKFILQSIYTLFSTRKPAQGEDLEGKNSFPAEQQVHIIHLEEHDPDSTLRKTAALSTQSAPSIDESPLDKALLQIKKDIQSGFPLEGLREKYKIDEKIAQLPEARQQEILNELSLTINRACFDRFIRTNREKIVKPVDFENDLIVSLGFTPSNHKEKSEIFSKFHEIYDDEIQKSPKNETLPLDEFQKFLLNCALRSRLSSAGIVNQQQIIKFTDALAVGQEMKKKLYASAKEVKLTFPSPFQRMLCPLRKKIINKKYQAIKSRLARDQLYKFFEKDEIKGCFLNLGSSPSHFKEELSQLLFSQKEEIETVLLSECEKAQQTRSLVEEMDLYGRWGSFIKEEMIQGFKDKNEVHDQGACLAICFRLVDQYQPYPDLDISEGLEVKKVDRFKQALYEIQPNLYLYKEIKKGEKPIQAIVDHANDYAKNIPEQFFKETSIKGSRKLFELPYDPTEVETDFQKRVKSDLFMKKLEQSNGWMSLSLTMVGGGHAVLMRLDKERNKAWFFDPNVGMLCFEEEGKSFEQARDDCLQCFKELTSHNYPLMYKIEADQFIHR